MSESTKRATAQVISIKKDEASEPAKKIDMRYLVRALVKYGASDLHLKVGRPPIFRINGKLIPAKMSELKPDTAESIIFGILTEKQKSELDLKKQIDLSFRVPELGRFRCNIFYQRGTLAAAIRMIPSTVPNIDSLGIPSVLKELCQRPRGLILITGATGSGKSTTMASAIQYINENHPVHVLSVEDPIEFVYRDMKASITQREIGSDANSMEDAIFAGLRQDPDIIVLGEMRNIETIQAALTAAETGHLVLSTLHTLDAKSSIDRILDVFDGDAQNQIRIQLSSTLIAVLCQQLVPRADGNGQSLACEVMIKSPTIENYIIRNELERIPEAIANSNTYYKMQTMNQSLEKLIRAGTITLEEAIKCSQNPDDLKLRMSGIDREEGYSR